MSENRIYMDSKEAADYLGVTDRTIRTLCTQRKITHERIGRNIRTTKEWLDEYKASITFTAVNQNTIKKENENNE